MDLFKKFFTKGEEQNQNTQSEQSENQEEVTTGTKIKVVAALLVVGFAAYVAYWIQEPVEVRTDLLGSTSMQSQGMSMQAGETQQIAIENFSFNPKTLNIDKGTTVVWTNKDQVPHNVVADTFVSPTLNPGDTFTHTFNDDGTVDYKCTFHPQMKAYIVVGTGVSQSQAAQNQVLNGFGAGSSLALETTTPTQTEETVAATETTTEVPTEISMETPAENTPPPAESIYTATAPAPASDAALHDAALQSLGSSLSNVGSAVSAQGSTPLNQETMVSAQQPQVAENLPTKKGKLAGSGPEDYVYAGIFGLVLFLNRKKLRKMQRTLR